MTYRILFVDDTISDECKNTNRQKAIDLISSFPNTQVYPVHPIELDNWLLSPKFVNVDLCIVDYKLEANPMKAGGDTFSFTGLSCVGRLRDKLPKAPIFLISAYFTSTHSISKPNQFDKFVTEEQITKKDFLLSELSAIESISNLANTPNKITNESVAKLLNTPECAKLDMYQSMGDYSNSSDSLDGDEMAFSSTGLSPSIEIYRWITGELFKTPGILLDRFQLSVLLGVEEQFLDKNLFKTPIGQELSEKCKYSGAWSSSIDLWWKCEIYSWLYNHEKVTDTSYPSLSEIFLSNFEIPENNMAKCAKCNEPYVDCVAYDDDSALHPAHLACTKVSIGGHRGVCFDPRREFTE